MSRDRIAIVGIGLQYPDAASPAQLWENVMAGRRAFRDIPEVRTSLADYWSSDPHAPDAFYSRKAAVLRDYEFDRVAHRVSSSTYRATDLTHWLALDVVGRALEDAGFPGGADLPRERTGAVIGNTLTGEFTRAGLMRLRWPYVRRALAAQLVARGWAADEVDQFAAELESTYKAPFPVPDEDSLAGGLANTIAGRVCNYFDLGGGGYTVDGACSSSLLAVVNAVSALGDGSLDVAIAGGVDLSIDPFELVGFARTGALATSEMKVYDAGSNGFWPGEGCGIVVLMRESDAIAQGRRVYACVAGHGVSSDGKGGITRPEAEGHRRAIHRAYERADYDVDTVGYFEGHGTGTAVGDATEIAAIAGALSPRGDGTRAALGSIKANIGHTKAAAGVAGLIKATLAVHHRVIPPTTGQQEPHPALVEVADRLHTPHRPTAWPEGVPARAGVSAMGFGGINTHLALEQHDVTDLGPAATRDASPERWRARQDTEVLLVEGGSGHELVAAARRVRRALTGAAMCELADVAAAAAEELTGASYRIGVVARTVEEAVARLDAATTWWEDAPSDTFRGVRRISPGTYVGVGGSTAPRVGLVFPGQGAGSGRSGAVSSTFGSRTVPEAPGATGTAALQPRIVARSLDVLDALERCGVTASDAVGHSLGEITALAWSGRLTHDQATRCAAWRGSCMAEHGTQGGAMAVLHTDAAAVTAMLPATGVVVSGRNAPQVTVVAGRAAAVEALVARAVAAGVAATRLDVDHAFHTDDFTRASAVFGGYLEDLTTREAHGTVHSTLTGTVLDPRGDLATHLARQMVEPVEFMPALAGLRGCDLVVEVGPGRALGGLVEATLPEVLVTRTDSDSDSLEAFLDTLAAAHAAGCDLKVATLLEGRVVRPWALDDEPVFLSNPCESVPQLDFVPSQAITLGSPAPAPGRGSEAGTDDGTTLEVVRRLFAERVELPLGTVTAEVRPLDDLHLSSITIAQVTTDAMHALGRPAMSGVPSFATATIGEIAELLDEAFDSADPDAAVRPEAVGVEPWVRAFVERLVPAPPAAPAVPGRSGWVKLGPSRRDGDGLLQALSRTEGSRGVLIDVRQVDLGQAQAVADQLLAWLRESDGPAQSCRIVVVQDHRGGVAGVVRSLHLEHPECAVSLVRVLPGTELGADEVAAIVDGVVPVGFAEMAVDAAHGRRVPRYAVAAAGEPDAPLSRTDVLLATGGGKGITAEACLDIAVRTGAAVGLLGRAPADDPAVAGTLARLRAAGLRHHYAVADVTDAGATASAVAEVERVLGPVTAVLHGAGVNRPRATLDLTTADLVEACGPKVDGLHHVLSAVDVARLRVLVGFGSIIGRAGLYGEGHYAMANDWLTAELEAFASRHPHVRVRALEWSVWTGAGMGESLGVLERLRQQGIEAIDTDRGLRELRRAINTPDHPVTTIVSARVGNLPTLAFGHRELPLRRFTERVVVDYPGVELVAEADVSLGSDRYLDDHRFEGELLFPAVLGLEAMSQVAGALADRVPTGFRDVRFSRPIVVPATGVETVRTCAVLREDGTVAVALRTAATDFVADHFSAVVTFADDLPTPRVPLAGRDRPIPLDPAVELYGGVLFQGDRFARIRRYHRAAARAASADLDGTARHDWFAPHLPADLVLGDPGARDALMHALQCCVPDAVLLPQGVGEVRLGAGTRTGVHRLDAVEVEQDGLTYVYDVTVRDEAGTVIEQWSDLRLTAVRRLPSASIAWSPAFLGPYLERSAEALLDGAGHVAVEPSSGTPSAGVLDRRAASALALGRAVGHRIAVSHRPDGRPVTSSGLQLSATHGAGLTTVIAAPAGRTVAIDVEQVEDRTEDTWRELLGEANLAAAARVAAERGEPLDAAATRVWTVLETLRKVGHASPTVQAGESLDDTWVRFVAGRHRVATWTGKRHGGARMAVAVLKGD